MSLILFLAFIFIVILAVFYANKHHIYYGNLAEFNFNNNQKKTAFLQQFLVAIIIVIFAWLCAERNINMSDAMSYIKYFKRLDVSSLTTFFAIDGRYEIGYEFLNKSIKLIFGNNYKILFALIVVINCTIVYFATSKINNSMMFFLMYLGFFGIYYNFIVLRQGLAISFVILALVYFNKHIMKATIFLIIGALFHQSILICILFFLVKLIKKGIRKETYLIVLSISLILYLTKAVGLIIEPLFTSILKYMPAIDRFAPYLRNIEYSNDISIMFLIYYATTFILIMKNKQSLVYNRFLFINVMGLLILGLFSSMVVIIRLVDYYFLSYVYLIPMAFANKNRLDRNILETGYFVLTTVFYLRFILDVVPFY